MNEIDLKLIYERFDSIDKQLKELREATKSIPIKIDYSISKSTIPQWEEGLVKEFNERPPMWPNESYTDYLKRIGQYNEASVSDTPQSDNEQWDEEHK